MRRAARLPVREIDLQDAVDRRATAPLVSVVIPVYNQGRYLAAAIESVLAQKYEPIELIVVDDGSSDDTPAVIAQYVDRISSIRQSNHGASHALNHGIQASHGILVCWLSADDEFLPGKLHAQVEAFVAEPDLWLCSTGFDVVDAAGNMVRRNPTTRWRHPDPFVAVLWENPINGSTVMVRREVFDQVGFFDTALRADVDADMWLRIAPVGRIVQLQGAFLRYRVHGASLSANRPLMIDSMTQVRLPHVESGRLRSRLGTGREAAEILSIMAAEYGWRGFRRLGQALLLESRAAGNAPRFQLLARAALAVSRWERLHRLLLSTGARLRLALRRRRESMRRT
jgi:teichuronic acid biosynthesis glycosyltransferase TuaG